jgi:hypothetical protein
MDPMQGCQMDCFHTKNTNLGKSWRALECKMLMYFMAVLNILQTFGIFMTIGYIFCSFGTFFPVLVSCTRKSLATLIQWSPFYIFWTFEPLKFFRIFFSSFILHASGSLATDQGDRIGRIFAHWATVYFLQFYILENYRSRPIWGLLFPRKK